MAQQHLSERDLERIISSEGSTVEKQNHLAQCTRCQNEIDKVSADQWWWNEGRELIASTVKLKEKFGSPPKVVESDGYCPVTAEVQQLISSFTGADNPESLGYVDDLEIESLIGVGGMGAVFKGRSQELNRLVAIKFLLPRHAGSQIARQRFSREAKAIAAVSDNHVIPVYRIDSTAKYPYFSMPFIVGVSLQQLVLENGPLESLRLVQIGKQVAAGLKAAHAQRLIHRDVKPANILIENDCNRVIVTDFGLAREESELGLTQTGMIAGTLPYMSPEQAEGGTLDQRSDLFSLGSVMHFMATGRPPFDGENQLELLKNIREAKAPSVRKLNSDISDGLEKAIQRLLDRDPAQRFQTAAETEEYLARFEAHLSSPRRNRQPRLARVKRPTNYGRCLIALAITLIFALSAMGFINWHTKTGLIPTIQFISVAPFCELTEAEEDSEQDAPLRKRDDDAKADR